MIRSKSTSRDIPRRRFRVFRFHFASLVVLVFLVVRFACVVVVDFVAARLACVACVSGAIIVAAGTKLKMSDQECVL